MKTLLALSLAFLLCFSYAYGLKCYQCVSEDSFDACDKARVNTTCTTGMDRCSKSELTGKLSGKDVKSYSKGCTTKVLCDNKDDICKLAAKVLGLTDYDCDVHCCEGDLCNGAQVPLISFLMLSTCALAAFIRLF